MGNGNTPAFLRSNLFPSGISCRGAGLRVSLAEPPCMTIRFPHMRRHSTRLAEKSFDGKEFIEVRALDSDSFTDPFKMVS